VSERFAFDEISEAEIVKAIAHYPPGKQASAVLPLLYIAQRQMARLTGSAWVPRAAMDEVAKKLSMPSVRVYENATFYLMFNTRPVGKYHLQVCTTTPCMLRGSDDIVSACKKISGIAQFGESSPDGLFTLNEVECMGACVNAPMIQINDDYFEDLDAARMEKLLLDLKAGKPLPPAGSTTGRHNSEPAPGRTTLLENAGAVDNA